MLDMGNDCNWVLGVVIAYIIILYSTEMFYD